MKTETTKTTTTPLANFRYKNENGKMISKDEAIQRRWAHKEDGTPTKIYLHRLAVREAEKNGLERPIRPKKSYVAGSQEHNGVASPYDLNRRSGYGTIWQVLAEHVGEVVPSVTLNAEVNQRLAETAPEWYAKKGYDVTPYDAVTNAYVMTRRPYNETIEAMQQRVTQEGDGFKLAINVTEPRELKKRGPKAKAKETVTPALSADVQADTDDAETIATEQAVTATA